MSFGACRFAGVACLCLVLGGCGSIVNIPLGSLWSSSKTEPAATASAAPPAPETTGSITPGGVTSEARVEKPGFLSNILPSFGQTKTAEAKKPDDKPFTLDAPAADVTGSIPPAAPEQPKTFAKEDQDAVSEVVAEVFPDKASPISQSWVNPITGYGGMVVPMAQLKKTASNCRELLISFGKGNKKDWYKSQSCQKSGKWQLGDVTAWRTSK
jgi:hypothetical protein